MFIHLLALILPGWIIVRLVGFQTARPVFIVASAYIYYTLLAIAAKWFDLQLQTFLVTYVLLLLVLALLNTRSAKTLPSVDRYWLIGLIVVVTTYSVYRDLVGPYTEIPADLYRHLEYARIQLLAIADGHLGPHYDIKAILSQRGGIWYSFYALISALTGLEFSQTYPWATYANSLIFLGSVFSFAWFIFERFNLAQHKRLGAALLATFFVASHLGLNVYSYLRYYAFAPTMLNMIIYFAAIIALLELFKWQQTQATYIVFLLFALFASTAIHRQEALYVLLMGGMMLAWYALLPKQFALGLDRYFPVDKSWVYRLLFAVFVLGFLALVIWTYLHYDRSGRFYNKVIQLSEQGPFFNRILFLNPAYQGIQVITIWGLAVYAVFFIYWKKFIKHPYLFAGMLLPITTVFNPVFVDWFLRVDNVHTLWRILYIVPIHFVAALSVIWLLSSAKSASLWWRKTLAYLMVVGLFALLLPIPGFNSNSRLTLASVDADESYVYWQDLIDYLNQDDMVATSILTDPVTGYVLSGLSKHKTYQYKFSKRNMQPFNLNSYDNAPLKRYKNWLLVINDRNGGHSETGEHARHWPENILDTASFYTQALRTHIRNNPNQRFTLLWEQENIRVYKIQ